jgi:uncharacterized integral membrane protein (TIGR00697 family)
VQQINVILNEIFYEGAFIFVAPGAYLQCTLRGLPGVPAHARHQSSAGGNRYGSYIGNAPSAFYQFCVHYGLPDQCLTEEGRFGANLAYHNQYPVLYCAGFDTNYFRLMIHNILKDKPTKLFLGITAFFVANALIAECIGGKLFSLEKLLGIAPANFSLFGESGLTFTLTCGVLLWPLEFVITDIVNEYYGPKAVRRISITAVALISYAFLMFYLAIHVPGAGFWIESNTKNGVPDMQAAFNGVFGQGMRIIVGSLVAFLVSQFVDVYVFHKIKKRTGEKHVWLRATGSTVVSQLVDSYVVLFIAFAGKFTLPQIFAIGMMNYTYKFIMAVVLTPVIYLLEKRIEKYLGHGVAAKMKAAAMGITDSKD